MSANQPELNLREQLIEIIGLEHYPGDQLIPKDIADFSSNWSWTVDSIIALFMIDKETAIREANLSIEFMMASNMRTRMMPLMVHTKDPDFPPMTKEILDQIWLWAGESIANWSLTHPQANKADHLTQVSLCPTCNSVTHTHDGVCTRCGEFKVGEGEGK